MNNTVNRASLGAKKNLFNFKRLWTDSHEKRSPQRFGRYAAMLIMLLTLGVGQMWGYDNFTEENNTFNNPYLYFYNSQDWNKAAVIFGRKYSKNNNDDHYTKVANMALVANTSQLYYVYINDYWNTTYNEIAVMEAEKKNSDWDDATQDIESRWGGVTNKTAIKWNYGLTDDYGTYYITSSGSNNIDISYKSDGYSGIPKCTTTVEVQTRNSTGTYTTIAADAPATLTVGGTYLSSMSVDHQIYSTTAYDANNWPTASTFESVISGLAKVKYASMDDKYQFDGWYVSDSQEGTGTEYTFYQTTNTTVVAKFTRLKYTVTFDQQSGSGGSSSVSATYNSAMPSATMPSRSGYTFAGYYTEPCGEGTMYYNSDGSSAKTCDLTSDITLYAKWEVNITLDKNGGTNHGSATAVYNSNSNLVISAPTHAEGYYILGYYKEPECTNLVATTEGVLQSGISGYTDADGKWIATEDKTLYAKWDNHYTVTFDQGSPTIQGTENTTATYGEAMPAITVPKKNGYIFGGYYTNTSDEATKYYNADGTSAKAWNIASNTTLHAKWTGITYHVEFNANGGTGSMAIQDLTYGTSTPLTSNTYTRDGYYFLGWNTNADGSGTAFYNGKTVSTMTTRAGQTITLYAQWAKTHTLYFLNMKVNGWHDGGSAANTNRYAYAYISYDGHVMYPLGTYETGTRQGRRMTASSDITLTNIDNGLTTWCWSIDGVPEGATILFSDNTDDHKSSNQSGWSADKPYFCNGNSTWYALDGENTISKVTDMSVFIGAGHFASYGFYALDQHEDGIYAIINLNTGQTYQYKYFNWRANDGAGSYSGAATENAYTINGSSTTYDYGGPNGMNGTFNYMVKTNDHATGEYKFILTWDNKTPQTTVRVPRGVTINDLSKEDAKAGESVTITLSATASSKPVSGTDMDNPTYYFEFSADNSNWTTIASITKSTETMSASTDYTFTARSGYFRVKLVNDNGVASYSGTKTFTAYSARSFYVYNPWNTDGDKWRWLHLYTWDSNDGNKKYNGDLGNCYIHCTDEKGTHGTNCLHGNDIVAMGDNWFYVTIDERANYFLIAGENQSDSYVSHKTGDLLVSNFVPDAKYMLTDDSGATLKEYEAKGASDYRLKYTGVGGTRYSDIYNTTLDENEVMASMWMNADDGTSTLTIEKGTGSDTWENAKVYSNSELKTLIPDTKDDHGYVFQMKVNFNTETPASSSISEVEEYAGPFYVRTNGLDGKWADYKKADHMMVKSEASLTAGSPAYNYYLCKWIESSGSTSVKFTVANDYNKELVASLVGDVNSTDPLYNTENLPANANVRFAWNSRTNTLTRAYISGSSNASDRFLVMTETGTVGKIYNERGQALTTGNGQVAGLNEHELLFADNGNWVYQLVMQANPGAQANVTAKYNNIEQQFMGNVSLLEGETSTKYTYRITYDFKTNILTNAWVVPDDDINEDIVLNSNIMLIRNGQEAAQELTFGTKPETTDHYSISGAKKLISVMQFDYDNMVGKMNSWNSQAYQYCMYYISFPFDVKVSDIFGIGTYGTDWKLQYYDGAERASKGFFRGDGTTTFWKDVPANGKLDKYVGYSLLLNRVKFNNGSSDIWENKGAGSSVYLYFPSSENAGTLQHETYTLHVPGHECTLPNSWTDESGTHYHRITDSHWNMIGVPILANSTVADGLQSILGTEGDFRYLYAWSYADNSLSVADAEESFTFHAMKAYMVQYHGDITFTGAGIHVPSLVAARKTEDTRNYNIELQVLNADEQEINHTYVKMQEGAEAGFALNEDLCMVTNNRAVNVYTYAGSYDVAANVLPIQNTTIPVGVLVNTAGTYTFSMPSNFSGTVTLVDTYTQTRTNLGIEDYEVTLNKGTVNDRFYLELDVQEVATAIDGVEGGSLKDGKAHKFIQNGVMYILENGKIYDARGNRVK